VANTGSAFAAAAFNRFAYNNRSELNESARYLGTDINNLTQPVTPEYRSFGYDPIGNRTAITEAANAGSYTTNSLNQYSTASLPAGGTNTFTHDLDGNLTAISGTKNVTYTYNAENRLITAQPTTPILNDKKLDFVYDYQGRRVQKITSNWNGASWVVETTKRFVYDGWNVLEEQTVSQPSKYYVWGLDLSQSLQGAGGVGGLLAKVESGTTHNYLYDGNGNVGQMINSSGGAIDAHYEYDPYGNSIVATGILAATNPYRFSTKYLDAEYNLYYYGHRYYDPEIGRWLNRDPIGEEGGDNLYAFVVNNPVVLVDPLGFDFIAVGRAPVGATFGGKDIEVAGHMSILFFEEKTNCPSEGKRFVPSDVGKTGSIFEFAIQKDQYELIPTHNQYVQKLSKTVTVPLPGGNSRTITVPWWKPVSISFIENTASPTKMIIIYADTNNGNINDSAAKWQMVVAAAKSYPYAEQPPKGKALLSNWPNSRYGWPMTTPFNNSNTFIHYTASVIGRTADYFNNTPGNKKPVPVTGAGPTPVLWKNPQTP
jgi:RHS repeat-associated protein